ncbi:MAG: type 1 glutamine amidotransferase domain-containing protein [Pseudomonadota bacterium]
MTVRRALFVLTSIGEMPGLGRPTGWYADEFATPYFALRDAGLSVDVASIQGGEPPVDANSLGPKDDRKPNVARMLEDEEASAAIKATRPVAEFDGADYDLVFLPGGHGVMWDFAQSEALAAVVGAAFRKDAVVGAVCHGPAGLLGATDAEGASILKGRRVNGFTDAEERKVELEDVVPYLLETRMRELGGVFEHSGLFESHAVRDGKLVTGQNPASVAAVSDLLLEALADGRSAAA